MQPNSVFLHTRVIAPPPVLLLSPHHPVVASLAATQNDRGMLADTVTPERPGPWSERVLLENVEGASALEGSRLWWPRWRDIASHTSRLCCGANADDHTPGPYHLTATLDSSNRLAFPVLRLCGLGLPCYRLACLACLVFNMVLIDTALTVPVCNSA